MKVGLGWIDNRLPKASGIVGWCANSAIWQNRATGVGAPPINVKITPENGKGVTTGTVVFVRISTVVGSVKISLR
jgi:hypothetical protein